MPNLIHLAIPAFTALLVLEAVAAAWMRRDLYDVRDTAASLAMGAGNVMVGLAAKAMQLVIFSFVYQFAFFHMVGPHAGHFVNPLARHGHAELATLTSGWATLNAAWWVWLLLFFADEISYYVFHRTSHECRFFWASHVVHHSSQHYNLSTALRQTWTGAWFGWIFWLWMPLVGFPPIMVLTMQAISLLYQFWIHTEMVPRLGPLEKVFNTPSHHRVHHGSNPRYIDRNHGGTLIIWDKLFGTFEPELDRVVYGLTKNIGSFHPVRIAFHEWQDIWRDVRSATDWRSRLQSVFGRPGAVKQAATLQSPVSAVGQPATSAR